MLDALVARLWRRRQFKMVRNTPSLAGGDLGGPHGDFGDDTLKRAFSALALECALPYDYHVPSRFAPSLLVAVVALDVLRPLLHPERDIGLRHGRILATVPVPKTAAHVDNRLSLENDNIRLARIALVAHLEPPTLRKQPLADKKLRLSPRFANRSRASQSPYPQFLNERTQTSYFSLMDRITPEQRSELMSKIRGKDTKPEPSHVAVSA